MGRYRKYPITIGDHDHNVIDEILEKYYERGDIDSVTVEDQYVEGKRRVSFWLECSEDDYIAVQNELTKRGVAFT